MQLSEIHGAERLMFLEKDFLSFENPLTQI